MGPDAWPQYAYAMRTLAIAALLLLAVPRAALATWSIIAIDIRTGQVIIASATCVRQMSFSRGSLTARAT